GGARGGPSPEWEGGGGPPQVPATPAAARRSEHRAQDKRHQDRVVELAGHWDEVGDQVDRHREVGEQGKQQEPAGPRDARVGDQPLEENDAVRDESCERTRLLAAPDQSERGDERPVYEDHRREADQALLPEAHRRFPGARRSERARVARTNAARQNPPTISQSASGREARISAASARAAPTPSGIVHVSPRISFLRELSSAFKTPPARGRLDR